MWLGRSRAVLSTMAEYPALPLWTDAYLGDTTHLTTLEHGAYLLLLMAMWRATGCRLPNDDKALSRYARLTSGQWLRIKPTVMAFFRVDGSWLTQGRLTDEHAAVKAHSKRQSARSKARWAKSPSAENHKAVRQEDVLSSNAPDANLLSDNGFGNTAGMPERCYPHPSPLKTAADAMRARAQDADRDAVPDRHKRVRQIGDAVLRLMGIAPDDPHWTGDYGRIHQWLADGADPEADIYPTVTRLVAKLRGKLPRSLAYFDAAIADARADRTRPMPTPSTTNQGARNGQKRPRLSPDEQTDADRAAICAALAGELDG